MATETGREWHWVYAGESDRTKSLCNCNDGQHAPPYLAAMTARDTSLFSVIIADHQQAALLQEQLTALKEELLEQKHLADTATDLLADKVGFTPQLVRHRLRTNYENSVQATLLSEAIAALQRCRFEGELPDEIMDEVDALIAILADRTASQQEAQHD